MAFDQTFAKNLNDFVHGVNASSSTTLPQVTGRKVKLITSTTASTATTSGSEFGAGSGGANAYTTGGNAITFSAATLATPSQSNNVAITITGMVGGTLAGVDIYSADTTPLRLEYGSVTPNKVINSGDSVSFTAGALYSTLQ